MSTEIIAKKLVPIAQKALSLVIESKDTMVTATELLSTLNQFNDKITEEKEKVTKPLNEALKAERNRWKPIETQYQEAIDHIRGQMTAYQTAEIKRQREEESKIAERVGVGRGKLKIETATKKLDAIEKVEASIKSDAGMVKFREDKVLKVIDLSKIPKKYFVLDESAVLADLKSGVTISGVELDIKLVPLNYR
jgi:hypothetical protein